MEERLAELEKALAERDKLIAELQAKLQTFEQERSLNSQNSNKPPSSDPPSQKKKKDKSNHKKKGPKYGHKGHKRQLIPIEQVQHIVELFPDTCKNCSKALPDIRDESPKKYQTIELPEIRLEVTEYRRHAVCCPNCRHITRAAEVYPASKTPFGPRLSALVALLTGAYHLSRRQTQKFLKEVLHLCISLGGISQIEKRATQAFEVPVQEIQKEVVQADVKYFDGTGWFEAGDSRQIWTIASQNATFFEITKRGDRDTLSDLFLEKKGILVSDRGSAFHFWNMNDRQLCWGHLMRKFLNLSQREGPTADYGRELYQCAEILFAICHDYQKEVISRAEFDRRIMPLRNQVDTCLVDAIQAGESMKKNTPKLDWDKDLAHCTGALQNLYKHKKALWTFLSHKNVDSTNNHAERELRGFVLWRKKCYGAQSQRGHQFAARAMSLLQTGRKRGIDIFSNFIQYLRPDYDKLPVWQPS